MSPDGHTRRNIALDRVEETIRLVGTFCTIEDPEHRCLVLAIAGRLATAGEDGFAAALSDLVADPAGWSS